MKEQLGIASRSAEAARESIVMTHRPKLIVRELDIPELSEFRIIPEGTNTQRIVRLTIKAQEAGFNKLTGSFRLTNKGSTTATVQLMEATMFLGHTLPPTNPCFGHTLASANPALNPGTTTRVNINPRPTTLDELLAIQQGQITLFVIGKLVYIDNLHNARRTGFARRFNGETGRFQMIKDEPDYEYVD